MSSMDGKEFADLTDCDISSIQSFLGAEVTHCAWGLGKIIRIDERRDDGPLFSVRFDSSTKEFNVDSFREGFITKIEMTAEVPAELHSWDLLNSYTEDDLDESVRPNIAWTKRSDMMKKDEKAGRIVYSTEHGRMCPNCGNPVSECTCRKKKEIPKGDETVRVGLD